MLDDLPPFLTVVQAAEACQISKSKAYGLTVDWERTDGERGLPFVRFGNQKRVPRAALERFIDQTLRPRPA